MTLSSRFLMFQSNFEGLFQSINLNPRTINHQTTQTFLELEKSLPLENNYQKITLFSTYFFYTWKIKIKEKDVEIPKNNSSLLLLPKLIPHFLDRLVRNRAVPSLHARYCMALIMEIFSKINVGLRLENRNRNWSDIISLSNSISSITIQTSFFLSNNTI